SDRRDRGGLPRGKRPRPAGEPRIAGGTQPEQRLAYLRGHPRRRRGPVPEGRGARPAEPRRRAADRASPPRRAAARRSRRARGRGGARAGLRRRAPRGPHGGATPRGRNDGRGVVVKGVMVDVRARRPHVDLEGLLDELMEEVEPDLNRYEGTFAAAAWDARARRGWAFNDQVSLLNLYYGDFDGGLYVASTAFPLAVALGLAPSAAGLQEFLARGCILAPASA